MNEQQFSRLLQAFDEKARECNQLAATKAMDYVRNNDPVDRERALAYTQNAELWVEAKRLAFDAWSNSL